MCILYESKIKGIPPIDSTSYSQNDVCYCDRHLSHLNLDSRHLRGNRGSLYHLRGNRGSMCHSYRHVIVKCSCSYRCVLARYSCSYRCVLASACGLRSRSGDFVRIRCYSIILEESGLACLTLGLSGKGAGCRGVFPAGQRV